MTVREKLKIILKASNLKQTELASRLGVTFAALNRWINNKAIPRPKAREKIDELFKEFTGAKQIPANILNAKKELLLKKRKAHKNVLAAIINNPDIRDQFCLSLTYHSNRIEGSTLSENETAAILFGNASLPNRSLIEQLEAKNHQAALIYLFEHLRGKNLAVNERLILKLHSILTNAIRFDAGCYRNHGVRILGARVPTANHLKVPYLMEELEWDIGQRTADVVAHISDIHSRFEQIHPFADGNGRVGRLLMHAMALKENFPPVVILHEKRSQYMTDLNKLQMKGDSSLLEDFVCDSILEGYRILERK